jgi:hypothetical protein
VQIIDAFPQAVAPVQLDYMLANQVERLNVSFHYRTWKVVANNTNIQGQTNISTLGQLTINNGKINYFTNTNSQVNQITGEQALNQKSGYISDPNFLIK